MRICSEYFASESPVCCSDGAGQGMGFADCCCGDCAAAGFGQSAPVSQPSCELGQRAPGVTWGDSIFAGTASELVGRGALVFGVEVLKEINICLRDASPCCFFFRVF